MLEKRLKLHKLHKKAGKLEINSLTMRIMRIIIKDIKGSIYVMTLIYPGILYPFSDGSGGFSVEFPDLSGCRTKGKDLEEAIRLGTDAASRWILVETEAGRKIPKASDYKDIHPKADGIVNLFALDMDEYAEKYGEKSVRKNLTIPAWLNTFAEKNNVNFSQVLQEALLRLSMTEH